MDVVGLVERKPAAGPTEIKRSRRLSRPRRLSHAPKNFLKSLKCLLSGNAERSS